MFELAARAWCKRVLSPPVIEAWYGLRARLASTVPLSLATTWIELRPGSPPDEIALADIVRLDEWLAIAETLNEHDLTQLATFRFHNDNGLVAEWAERLVSPKLPHDQALIAGVLARMTRLFADFAVLDAGAIVSHRLAAAEEVDARWWIPGDIAAPPTTELVGGLGDFAHADVRRVLEDL